MEITRLSSQTAILNTCETYCTVCIVYLIFAGENVTHIYLIACSVYFTFKSCFRLIVSIWMISHNIPLLSVSGQRSLFRNCGQIVAYISIPVSPLAVI